MKKSTEIFLRCAKKSDMEAIRGILNHYILNTAYIWSDALRLPRDVMRMYRSHQYSDRTPLMVAELDGKVVGFSALSFVSMSEGWREITEEMVYVHPAFVGQGIGRKLLEGVMERGYKTGLYGVLAKIDMENIPSLRLHRAFGFEECGTLRGVGVKFGQRRSCVQMIYYYGR